VYLADGPQDTLADLLAALRAARFDTASVNRDRVSPRAWLDACAAAAGLYPCAAVGVDLLFERGYLRHHVLEVNAFGDFFPGFTNPDGRTVHRTEIEETARRFGLLG